MPETPWDRRELLKAISAGAVTGFLAGGARDAAAQQVKWSEGTEPPKLKAPPNACDCHHHIYDAKYPVDPKAVLRPGDALVEDYRAFQKQIGTSRDVVVTPSTYGVDNRVTLDAVATLGPQARGMRARARFNGTLGEGIVAAQHGWRSSSAAAFGQIRSLSRRETEVGFAADSLLEGDRFEPSVPVAREAGLCGGRRIAWGSDGAPKKFAGYRRFESISLQR